MSESIQLYRGHQLLIERSASGAIHITRGAITVRLSEAALERLYDALGDALAVLALAELGFPPSPALKIAAK